MIMTFQNHPAIAAYQANLAQLKAAGHTTETQTRAAFRRMLEKICDERELLFVEEFPVGAKQNRKVDGAVQDAYSSLGYWEAKDEHDDLETEIKRKIAFGYPLSNIIFEDTKQAILWQNQKEAGRFDLSKNGEVSQLLAQFFGHTEADREGFEDAVRAFVTKIPELAGALRSKIDGESDKGNPKFKAAFGSFLQVCKSALNPNIKEPEVKEMLVQHLLTERLFRVVFQNAEWVTRNVIAAEIETVIAALTSKSWSRAEFLKSLDPFYKAIEDRARTLPDYSSKQGFLNNVYERFFQGYSVETADTMGIVYTPQEIVDWMCESVERVLETEFGSSLATPGVQVLDPCTGTGNFIVNVMNRIPSVDLQQKYEEDLFANEIMLLPYYVASGNIEHAYFERLGEYAAFEGLCFADTLDLFQGAQASMFVEKNTARVEKQKAAEITVIIGNPPYNVGQKNENDNNKNRSYKGLKNEKGIDDLIRESYAKASKATLQNKLYDAYVRFFKWASERLKNPDGTKRDGVICFVSNNSFIEQHAFDGMRKCLGDDFNHIWHLDLHGNVRKNPKLSGTTHNVFGIQVGVGITILVRNSASQERFIRYHRVLEDWRKTDKIAFLADTRDISGIEWQTLSPNAKNAWLTEGLEDDFETFTPLGSKAAKASSSTDSQGIFKSFSCGLVSARDFYVYDFEKEKLKSRAQQFVEIYEQARTSSIGLKKDEINNLIDVTDRNIKWSRQLKALLKRGEKTTFDERHLREVLYRPFTKKWCYFDDFWNEERYQLPKYFPLPESENRTICFSGVGHDFFIALMSDKITDCKTSVLGNSISQCFPLYTYSGESSTRFDNITSYALEEARRLHGAHVTREDVFYASYALLHHPQYRLKYAENLKRELPRLPLDFFEGIDEPAGALWAGLATGLNESHITPLRQLVVDASGSLGADSAQVQPDAQGGETAFMEFARIGRALGDLHVGYDHAKPFSFQVLETKIEGRKFSHRVQKMKFNAERTQLKVNEFITLSGFTPEMFAYKLGNRSALDWVVESYRVKEDARSGLVSDPNRKNEPKFILDLIGKVATVSLETQRLIAELPPIFVLS